MQIEYQEKTEEKEVLPRVKDLEPGTVFWWAARPVLKLYSGVIYKDLNEPALAVCLESGSTYGSPTMGDARVHVIKDCKVVIYEKEPL